MKRRIRVAAVLLLSTVGFMGLLDTPALARSDQRCSARGNQSEANCTTIVNVGDVDITIVASRLLNKVEIKNIKNSFGPGDSLSDIVAIVENLVLNFENIDVLGSVCAQKGLLNICA